MKCLYCNNEVLHPHKLCKKCKIISQKETYERHKKRLGDLYKLREQEWKKLTAEEQLQAMLQFTEEYMKGDQLSMSATNR